MNTWALGALAPGKTRTFIWHVVPVKAGAHTVHYSVAAGLAGKAKARLTSGAPAAGQFAVNIAPAPKLHARQSVYRAPRSRGVPRQSLATRRPRRLVL